MDFSVLNTKLNAFISKSTFYQAIEILLQHLHEYSPNEDEESLFKRLKFKANPSLSFAKSEIHAIEFKKVHQTIVVEVTLNFLALFGSSSPLPSHYSEMILESSNGDKVLMDFLNLFNHHLQRSIYTIWKKQRYYVQFKKDFTDKFSSYFLGLVGLYFREYRTSSSLDICRIMPYIGLLSMREKSTGSLRAILRHYLEHDAIEIMQFIPMSANIPNWQRNQLAHQNSNLGTNCMLGETIKTRNLKFQIFLKDIPWSSLYEYSMYGKKIVEVRELIDLALHEPLEYEFCCEIKKENIEPIELSKHYLGINSFLGQVACDTQIILCS
jgi:type VI secretion system protein ImpH